MEAARQLLTVLESLLSPCNETRSAGETALHAAQTQQSGAFVQALLVVCGDWCDPRLAQAEGASCLGASAPMRSLAAVLLRRHLIAVWASLDGATQVDVKRLSLIHI